MKPIVNHKKCFADVKVCTAKTACPVNAIAFMRVKEPMLDKVFTNTFDRCPLAAAGIMGDIATADWNEPKLGVIGTEDNPLPVGDAYVRVVIDYDKCTCCGLCVEGCCGYAIDMVDDDVAVENYDYNPKETKQGCGCGSG